MKRNRVWLVLFFLSVTLSVFCKNTVYAKNPVNQKSQESKDGGGSGTNLHYWRTGDFGVRFTLINKATGERLARSIDYFKLEVFKDKRVRHSGGVNKLEYMYLKNKAFKVKQNDSYHNDKGGYAFYKGGKDGLWNVITSDYGRKTSLKHIKQFYVNSNKYLKKIARDMGQGVTLAKIRDKENILMYEPIYYFFLNGEYYALTATEIAFHDEEAKLLGKTKIESWHSSFSHKAIPISTYLKRAQYNIGAYKGNVKKFSNAEITSSLGVGMLNGTSGGKKTKKPKLITPDYVYKTETDVYTAVTVTAGSDATPDNPIRVEFDIPGIGKLQSGDYYVPAGKEQLVWVKWRTGKDDKELIIKATIKHGGHSIEKTINAVIERKILWEPKNPKATDMKPDDLSDFKQNFNPSDSDITDNDTTTEKNWSIWEVFYQPYGDFLGWGSTAIRNKKGKVVGYRYYPRYDNQPYYAFGVHSEAISTSPSGGVVRYLVNGRTPTSPKTYSVKLNKSIMEVVPGQTVSRTNKDKRYVKSGYGIEANVKVEVKGSGLSNCTGFQTTKYFFPEFNYKTYWRWGDYSGKKMIGGKIQDSFSLPRNNYSYSKFRGTSEGRYHFLPVWFPDGEYRVYAEASDCWTPAGELTTNMIGKIECKGSLFDDWHIQPSR